MVMIANEYACDESAEVRRIRCHLAVMARRDKLGIHPEAMEVIYKMGHSDILRQCSVQNAIPMSVDDSTVPSLRALARHTLDNAWLQVGEVLLPDRAMREHCPTHIDHNGTLY